MKLKSRLIIDAIMFLIIWIVMKYSLTGNLVHELLGTVLIAVFLLHIVINFKYYIAMTKNFCKENQSPVKGKGRYITNVVLLLATITMLISSIAISHDLFASFNSMFSDYVFWKSIHILSAITILICMFVHVLFHKNLFWSILKNKNVSEGLEKTTKLLSGILAIFLAIVIVEMSIKNATTVIDDHKKKKDNYDNVAYEKTTEEIVTTEELKPADEKQDKTTEAAIDNVQEDKPTLEDYLGKLVCTGCGRRCSLLSPRCGKGERQASKAESEYYSTYGDE